MSYFKKVTKIILVLLIGLLLMGCPDGEERGGADVLSVLTDIERVVFDQVNQYRVEQGLTPLKLDMNILIQARKHSQNMAEGIVPFGHEGFEERAAATNIKIDSVSENVAYYQEAPNLATTVVDGWPKARHIIETLSVILI